MTLAPSDFSTFFEEVYGPEPFPWQKRLLEQVAETGAWPDTLHLPTGSGKTAAIDIAIFHLALEADRGSDRRAPVRIAFVVDRRLVVDDAYARAKKLKTALIAATPGSTTALVAERLARLGGSGLHRAVVSAEAGAGGSRGTVAEDEPAAAAGPRRRRVRASRPASTRDRRESSGRRSSP